MGKKSEISPKKPVAYNKVMTVAAEDMLCHLAFDNTFRANIISTVNSGNVIMCNKAACRLLGYSKKELLTQSRSTIFDIKESSFKKMLRQRSAEGRIEAIVTAIKKNGKQFPGKINSVIFKDEDGVEKSITTITDMSQIILKQKNIDSKREKIVADDIMLALAKSDERLAENNEWIKYIAKTSYDVMWDWNIATNEIYVGDSIEEVFGYKIENNTVNFTDFIGCLLLKEKKVVEENLWKTLAAGKKSWDDSYQFIRRDGSIASTTSRAYIVRDKEGKAIRLIGAIQDVSRLHEMETDMELQTMVSKESRAMFLQVGKISFDVIWDRNLLTNEVIRGEGIEEILGFPLKDYKGKVSDLGDHIHPYDKKIVEKSLEDAIASSALRWEQAFRIIRADGSVAKVYDRASIFRQADGKAYRMIGAMHDLSRQKELEEKLHHEIESKGKLFAEYNNTFKLIFNSSSDVLYDNDLITGTVTISDAYEKEYGYKLTSNMTLMADWMSHVHPEDRNAVQQEYLRVLSSKEREFEVSYRFLKADGSVVNVKSRAVYLRNAGGKAYRVLGYMQDMNKQVVLEEKLEQEIKLKEKQIANAVEEAKESERSNIGKELHDNVNQLLGASRLYLGMAKRGGVNSKMFLNRSSEYTMTAIEEIRKLTHGLTTDTIKNLGLGEAIDNIARDTMEITPVKISVALHGFIEKSVTDKFKLNLYRIVQEQLNNILKHANATKVNISLLQNKNNILLSISDDGAGFDTAKKMKGIGVANIKSRVSSYNGTAEFVSQPGKGCVLTAIFPVADALLSKSG